MSSVWFNRNLSLSDLAELGKNTMTEYLGMKFIEIGDNFLRISMPVDHRTHQPYGILHGGASVALAETAGSVGSYMIIDNEKYICVGLEVNANHIRSVKEGVVTGTATPIHIGRSTHIWQIRITDEHQKLVCISRLTVAILEREISRV
jgi:1,4-dihydroxy-2-naphthoyl-CoA hydrolase